MTARATSAAVPRASALESRLTTVVVVAPLVGFVLAIGLWWGTGVDMNDLLVLAGMYALAGFGITVGFHRMLTHRSFDAPTAVRATLAILGSMAAQGAVIHWVADHRQHHMHSDRAGDPHSPHGEDGEGWCRVLRGVWHAHLGWLLGRRERPHARRYAPDLRRDPVITFVDRWFPAWLLLGLLIPFVVGLVLSGG